MSSHIPPICWDSVAPGGEGAAVPRIFMVPRSSRSSRCYSGYVGTKEQRGGGKEAQEPLKDGVTVTQEPPKDAVMVGEFQEVRFFLLFFFYSFGGHFNLFAVVS